METREKDETSIVENGDEPKDEPETTEDVDSFDGHLLK